MRRVWTTERDQKQVYVIKNRRNGMMKFFKRYDDMHEWYLKLPIQKSLDWAQWTYII